MQKLASAIKYYTYSVTMFSFLKRLVLYIILTVIGHSKRVELVKRLTKKTRKRNYINDIKYIPAILDDITDLPDDCRDTIGFAGFDKNGVCARICVKRDGNNRKNAIVDLNLPGVGSFRHEETTKGQNARNVDDDDVCDGLRLKLFCQKGMLRWRIFLRAPLKHMNADGQRLHATISLYWTCLFDPFDHLTSPSCLDRVNNLIWLPWTDIFSNPWQDNILRYEQFGELRGRIAIENHEEQSVRLKCARERCFIIGNNASYAKVFSEHIVLEETGLTLSNTFIKLPNNIIRSFGCVSYPVGDTVPVRTSIQDTKDSGQIKSLLSETHDFTDKEKMIARNTFRKPCFNDGSSDCVFTTGFVNNRRSFGLQQSFNTASQFDENANDTTLHDSFITREASLKEYNIRVVSLDEEACRSVDLAGGKARNLSVLKQLKRYNVPNGICVTTNAYREHVSKHSRLRKAVANISTCLRNGAIAELQTACSDAVETFRRTSISDGLQREIRNTLSGVFGEDRLNDKRFAIRSSGECEDGAQLSSAGQMDTFLSVKGVDNIMGTITLCWASSVSYRVVEYRRQNGQCVVEDLGVVLQEMVDAEKAGVLFTNDPVTGNESIMVINASYGLGEAVVSGQVNADTVIAKRDQNDKVTLVKRQTGDKRIKVVADSESGVKTETVSDNKRSEICLTAEEVETICESGIAIENEFGVAQDIEWAISQRKLVILQSRPITVLDVESDEEIMHEFDMPVVNENLLFTTANAQEALPGALTPLSSDIMLSAGSTAVKRSNDARLRVRGPVHPVRHILPFAGVPLLNMTCVCMAVTLMMGENTKPDIDLNVMGQTADEHTIKTIKDFYGRPYPAMLQRFLTYLKLVIAGRNESALFDKCKAKADTLKIGEDASTTNELYKAIDENLSFINDMLYVYFYKSSTSSIWAHVIMDMLKGSSSGARSSTDVMADIALILSECKYIYSADVPSALNSLAEEIAKSDLKEDFLETPDQDCDMYLKLSDHNEIQSHYTQFLCKHGHRCIREGEFYMKSWRQNPVPLIKTVKQIIKRGNFEGRKESMTVDEIVKSLKTPLSYVKRMLLRRYLVQKARGGVRQREVGKTTLIKTGDTFKQAFWKLAVMMVKEGRLPDERLLFFLTHHEIGRLQKPSPLDLSDWLNADLSYGRRWTGLDIPNSIMVYQSQFKKT